MVKIVPYLSVKSAIEALELYETIFDAKVKSRMPVEAEQAESMGLSKDDDLTNTTMHGEFEIAGQDLYISDNFSGKVLDNTNVSILLEPDDLEQMQSFFERAKDNGCTITMDLEKQFWGSYFTSFIDPYGISWQLNFTPEED